MVGPGLHPRITPTGSPELRHGRAPVGASHHESTASSLFPGGVGNTQKDAARFASLIDDAEARLSGTLPDDTWVYPRLVTRVQAASDDPPRFTTMVVVTSMSPTAVPVP
jgi:hypothetical protein